MKLAVIRIKGDIGLNEDAKKTFRMLNLNKKFACSVLEDNPVNKGMIRKIKDFSTYGNVSEETLALLKKKEKEGQKCYNLHPPVGGFERKGTKKSFNAGGALGERGDKINDLIKRMLK